MSHYSHLTSHERYQISALLKSKIPVVQIARVLNRARSSIYREIRRNSGKRGYRPKQAHAFCGQRKAQNQGRLTEFFWAYVDHLLAQYYSPQQICGRLQAKGWLEVGSVESLYQYIYSDKAKKGSLHTFLRCQKHYRKRYAKAQDRRGQIFNRQDISERAGIIEQRIRSGDFEGDTMVGKNHKGVLVTLVDRATRLTKMRSLPHRKAVLVSQTCIDLLKSMSVHSITFDNGKEFAAHGLISQALGAEVYFAKPYRSWERGTNENTNGLIRQFFGKHRRLDHLCPLEVQRVEDLLNNRPRKVLGYLTPIEALVQNHRVALHT